MPSPRRRAPGNMRLWLTLPAGLERDRREARRRFSASLLSNTKWRKIIRALEPFVETCTIKFVGVAQPLEMSLPWDSGQGQFVDSVKVGPFPLVAIEWLEIPGIQGGQPADLAAVEAAISKIGLVRLDRSAASLRILAHVR
jgi:hypothetical protein